MINIIAHGGFWIDDFEKNTLVSINRAFEYGFGIETDFRDLNGKLVISHDMPVDGAMSVDEFVDSFKKQPVSAPVAINIKSDGLHNLIKEMIVKTGMSNCFVFDMSVPDTRGYLAEQIPVFTRLSEYETSPVFFEKSHGVWLDAFESEWFDTIVIQNLLDSNKQVAIVSPELHRRPYLKLWNFLKENNLHQNALVSLCTDFPLEAKEYFNV